MRRLIVLGLAVGVLLISATSASAAIKITKIQYDSPGSDTGSNSSLNAEYVVIKNTGSGRVSLTGWTLRDTAGHVYRFGTFRIGGGKSVTIHTGSGSDDRNDLYWGSGWYIWNNDGDTATLKDNGGHRKDHCHYSGGDTYVIC